MLISQGGHQLFLKAEERTLEYVHCEDIGACTVTVLGAKLWPLNKPMPNSLSQLNISS